MSEDAESKGRKRSKKSASPKGDAAPAWSPARPTERAAAKPERYEVPTNQVDAQGLRTGLWLFTEANNAFAEETYRAGRLEGRVRRFRPDGSLEREWEMSPDLEHFPEGPRAGVAVYSTPTGAQLSTLFGSRYVGVERRWYPSGALSLEQSYDADGLLHGVARAWNEEGELQEECPYERGLRHGTRYTLEKGSYKSAVFERGVPELQPRSLKSLLNKLAKAKDDYKVGSALDEYVPYEARPLLAWHLVRTQQWKPYEHGWAGVDFLRSHSAGSDLDSVLEVLRGAAEKLDTKSAWPSLQGWPYTMDEFVARHYRREDDARWLELARSLPAPLATGIHFVRGRCGAALEEKERTAALDAFAEALVEGRAASTNPLSMGAGATPQLETRKGPEHLARLVAFFGTEEDFTRALCARGRSATKLSAFYNSALFQRAEPELLGALLRKTECHEPSLVPTFSALPQRPLGEWMRVAGALCEGEPEASNYHLRRAAESVFVLAAQAAAREGAEVPESLDRFVSLESVEWSPGTSEPYKHLPALREALRALPAPRLRALAARIFARPYGGERAAALVGLAPSEEQLEQLLALARRYAEGTSDRNSYRHFAHAAGLVGEAGVERFRRVYEDASQSEGLRALSFRVFCVALSQAAEHGVRLDPSLARYVDLHRPNGERPDKLEVEWLWAPVFSRAVRGFDAALAESVALRNLDPQASHWSAPFCLVVAAPTDAVVARAGALLAARLSELDTWDRYLQAMMKDLGEARARVATKLLEAVGPERATLRKVLANHLAPKELEAVDAALPALEAPAEALGLVQRIEKLAAQLELPKVSVYVLERVDEDAGPEEVLRSGGRPLGVSKEEWPLYKRKEQEHVLTLDLDAMPDLRARRGLGAYRAVSVFVPDRATGEAMESGEVRMLTQEQVARGLLHEGASPESAQRIRVTRVLVPEQVFRGGAQEGLTPVQQGALRALRTALYQAPGRALGLPFWIQQDPDEYGEGAPGQFLLQFDEHLAEINTGDLGLIYVFTGGVLMQCH